MAGSNDSPTTGQADADEGSLTGAQAFAFAEAAYATQWGLASELYQRIGQFEGSVEEFTAAAAQVIMETLADSCIVVLVDLPDRSAPVHSYAHRDPVRRRLARDLFEEIGSDQIREWVTDVTATTRRFTGFAEMHDPSTAYTQRLQRHLDDIGVTEVVYAPIRYMDGRTRGLLVCSRDAGQGTFSPFDLIALAAAAGSMSMLLDAYLAQQAAAATNRYWSTAFEAGPFGKVVLDRDRTYIRVNQAACDVLGFDRWEVLGKRWPAEPNPQSEQLQEDLADIERARRGLPVPDRLRQVRLRNADPVWILRSIAPVFDDAGEAELFHLQFVDVTALHDAEETVSALAEQRRVLLSQLVSAEQAERHRIAQDVHDDSIQLLAAAQLRMQLLVNQLPRPSEGAVGRDARVAADNVAGLLSTAQRRLRQLLLDLEPPSTPGRAVDEALRQAAYGFFEGTHTEVRVHGSLQDVPEEVASVFYRAAREALANVLRHADANTVTVTLLSDAGRWTVTVVDDGVGVPEEVQPQPGHLGLRGMRSRIEALGGTCSVVPLPERGTEVVLSVPRG